MPRDLFECFAIKLPAVEVHARINADRIEAQGSVNQGELLDSFFPIDISDQPERPDHPADLKRWRANSLLRNSWSALNPASTIFSKRMSFSAASIALNSDKRSGSISCTASMKN